MVGQGSRYLSCMATTLQRIALLALSALFLPACNVVKMQARHTKKEFKKAGLTEHTFAGAMQVGMDKDGPPMDAVSSRVHPRPLNEMPLGRAPGQMRRGRARSSSRA